MPIFLFKGRDPTTGKAVSGKRLAQSANNLSNQLVKEGIIPVNIILMEEQLRIFEKLKGLFFSKTNLIDELSLFSRQMYILTKTGVSITDSIKQLADTTRSPVFSQALHGVLEKLEGGQDLATAMQEYETVFTPLMISIVRVGQDAGRLEESFLNLNQYLELEGGAIKKLKASLRYPGFVLVAIVAAFILMNIFVLPTFARIFQGANLNLPRMTEFLLGMSSFFTHYWWVVLGLIIVIIALVYSFLKKPENQRKWDKFKLNIPILGPILKRVILLRFAQTFAVTLHSDIPLDEGLYLTSKALGNTYATQEIMLIRERIQHGNSFVQAARSTDLFTSLELQMLGVSDKTGELRAILEQMVMYYQREVSYDLKRISDLMEPLLIIMLAGMIAMLAFAVYLPIWNMVKMVHT